MSKLDLTVRDQNEAGSYGLSLDQYDELREKFEKRTRERLLTEVREQAKKDAKNEIRSEVADAMRPGLRIDVEKEMRPGLRIDVEKEMRPKLKAEIEKELRAELPDELRPKLREELLPEVRKQVETELSDKLRAEARVAIAHEVASQQPTTKDRAGFSEFVREEEVACLTQAQAASVEADKAESALLWGRRIRLPLAYILFAALPVLAFFLYQQFLLGIGFAAFLAPAVFVAVVFAGSLSRRHNQLRAAIETNRKTASAYSVLAEKAKRLRLFTAHAAQTKEELSSELDAFASGKHNLDNSFSPATASLERSREEIRDRLLSELDTDKLLRVAPEPEPELDEETHEGLRSRA